MIDYWIPGQGIFGATEPTSTIILVERLIDIEWDENMVVYPGDNIRSQASTYDYDQVTPLTPDSFSVSVYDPTGTLRATYTNPTQISTGQYYINHSTSSSDMTGTWRVVWSVTSQGVTDTEIGTVVVHPR